MEITDEDVTLTMEFCDGSKSRIVVKESELSGFTADKFHRMQFFEMHDVDPKVQLATEKVEDTMMRMTDSATVRVHFKDGYAHDFPDVLYDENRMETGFLTMEDTRGDVFHVVDVVYWTCV